MELRDHVSAVRKRWWLVATTACLALAAAVFVTARTAPTYAASVTFFVSTPSSGVTDAYQGGLLSSSAPGPTSTSCAATVRTVVRRGGVTATDHEFRAAVAGKVAGKAAAKGGQP